MPLNALATLEWHYYCPCCERSNFTRFHGNIDCWKVVRCSDCGESYMVEVREDAAKALLKLMRPERS
jgi:transposase-like protein